MSAERELVIVLLHLADAGFGDDEVLAFLSTWADDRPEARKVVAAGLREAASDVLATAEPEHAETVNQWIELLAALEAWHHLRAALARSSGQTRRRSRPLRARP